ncbi:MAG: hypothetical protein AB8H12_09555, partial [Lewinella sp.]
EATTPSIEGLLAGAYNVTVTDENGCTEVGQYTVTDEGSFGATAIVTDVSCNGAADGSISLELGGTAPYTYVWSNESNEEALNGLAPGIYSVTITDATGCTAEVEAEVSEPGELVIEAIVTNTGCSGEANGAIDLVMTGGTPPYTYEWARVPDDFSIPPTTPSLSGLSSGFYFVTVTDANGCAAELARIFVVEQGAITGEIEVLRNASCSDEEDGALTAIPISGNEPYTYNWSNGESSQTIEGLAAAVYTVTITDGAGCAVILEQAITAPEAISVDADITDANCSELGTITLFASGGRAPYSFLWDNEATTSVLEELAPGDYGVTITDENDCQFSETFTVSDINPLNVEAIIENIDCNGAENGTITLVHGGEAPFTYEWGLPGASGDIITGLAPGTYFATVTDAAGCTQTIEATVTEPALLAADFSTTEADCDGGGSIGLTVTGGVSPYVYSWSNGATSADQDNLLGGIYIVVITDANGCQLMEDVNVPSPEGAIATISATDAICNGDASGNIDLTITDGFEPFRFEWSNGPTTEDNPEVSAGLYSVTITDGNGCRTVQSAVVGEPAAIDLNAEVLNITCIGNGSIELIPANGLAPYGYLWSTGATTRVLEGLEAGTYSVIVTDANDCRVEQSFEVIDATVIGGNAQTSEADCTGGGILNFTPTGGTPGYTYAWSNGAVTEDLSDIIGGNYIVSITDQNGCTGTESFSVPGTSELIAAVNVVEPTCPEGDDGTATITVSNGTVSSIRWSTGATGAEVTGLSAGLYAATVTDEDGCQQLVSLEVKDPAGMQAVAEITTPGCEATGAIDLTVSGGTAPYRFRWNTDATTEDVSGLDPGTYFVVITDVNNCSITETFDLELPDPINVEADTQSVTCNDNGSITLRINGGSGPYSVLWNTGETANPYVNLAPGNYFATVTDANGCTAEITVEVANEFLLEATAEITGAGCNAGGAIDLTVSEGTAPYSFNWSNGAVTEDLENINGGEYSVLITDTNGCTITRRFNVPGEGVLTANLVTTNVSCFGESDGRIAVEVTTGVPVSYQWTNEATTDVLTGLSADTYAVTITDENDCTTVLTAEVSQPDAIEIDAVVMPAGCGEGGSINVTLSGGTPGFSYNWSNGANTEVLTDIPAGMYFLTVTDANGCMAIDSMTVTDVGSPELTANVEDITCAGANDGSIFLNVVGGTASFSILWEDGGGINPRTGLNAGVYSVTITDDNGCEVYGEYELTSPEVVMIDGITTDATCEEGGSITVRVSGGAAPYTYQWSGGAEGENPTDLPAGEYNLVVTDANGCAATSTFAVGGLDGYMATAEVMNVTCNDGADGAIDLNISGGQSPYRVSWDNGATTEDLAELVAGTYIAEITDAGGCQTSITVEVAAPGALDAGAVIVPVSCEGPGSITLNVSGGTMPYSYRWSNGSGDGSIDNIVAAAAFAVTVTDANGCTLEQGFDVGGSSELSVSVRTEGTSCNGSRDGVADLTVTGGTRPYSFRWNTPNNDSTEDVDNLPAGEYTVEITDADGCMTVRLVTIETPSAILLGCTPMGTTGPGTTDGSIEVTVSGGAGGYIVSFTNGADISGTESALEGSLTLIGLPAGTYTITAVDANGCPSAESCIATVNGECSGDINEVLNAIEVSPPLGCDVTEGYLRFVGENLTDYEFSIDFGVTWSQETDYTGLPTGSYSTMARRIDGTGCMLSGDDVDIREATTPEVGDVIVAPPSDCAAANGSITIQMAAPGPYLYSIDGGQQMTANPVFNGLPGGAYQIMVIDTVSGCSFLREELVNLSFADQPIITDVFVRDVTDCIAPDGTITLTVVGITNTSLVRITGRAWQNDFTFSGLTVGSYTAELRDETTGCYFTWPVDIVVGGQAAPTIDDVVTSGLSSCGANDGRLFLSAMGSNLEYTFDGGETWTTDNSIGGLSGGMITAGVRNADQPECVTWVNDLFIDGGFTATVDSLTTTNPVDCDAANGSINIFGAAGQQYSIDGGVNWQTRGSFSELMAGTYTILISDETTECSTLYGEVTLTGSGAEDFIADVNVSDANNCAGDDGSFTIVPGQSGLVFSVDDNAFSGQLTYGGLMPGNYLIQAQDPTSACGIDSMYITIAGFPALIMSLDTSSAPPCYAGADGLIFVSATGGDGDYTFNWSDGGSGAERNDLAAGAYQLTVTDGRGCTDTLTIALEDRADFAAVDAAIRDTAVCATSAVLFDLGDLENDLTYLWTQPDGVTTSGTSLTTNLEGLHTLLVSDTSGCSFLDTFFVDFASEQEFFVDFLLPERALVFDSTAAIDITWPIPDSVTWVFDDPNITDLGIYENQQWLEFAAAGTYEITLEAFSGGCSGSMSREVQVFESRDSIPFYDSLQVGVDIRSATLFPNPHEGIFEVDVDMAQERPVTILILDALGQPVDQRNLPAGPVPTQYYNLPQLPAGTYTLLVRTATSQVSLRHIKTN